MEHIELDDVRDLVEHFPNHITAVIAINADEKVEELLFKNWPFAGSYNWAAIEVTKPSPKFNMKYVSAFGFETMWHLN
jgi:hypothetical protein